MGVRFDEIVIDCADPESLASFWSAVTGYELQSASDQWAAIVGEGMRDICIAFQRVPEDKVTKNRVHIDLSATDENEEAVRIEGLGATRLWVSDKADDPFVVLADPEGNEFCVVRQSD
jgi:predicted enzyme related to lactoylglutathione lyase